MNEDSDIVFSFYEQWRLSRQTPNKSFILVIDLTADTFWSSSIDNIQMTDFMDCDSDPSQ